MIQIHETLYVGSDADVHEFNTLHPNGYIIHAAKDPWHRKAVGYTGRGAPAGPYYYGISEDDYLALNLVDSPDKKYIAKECFDLAHEALQFMYETAVPVLLHCNQGKSRSAGILFYHMLKVDGKFIFGDDVSFDEAVAEFTANVYPNAEFGTGVEGFLEDQWNALLDGELA